MSIRLVLAIIAGVLAVVILGAFSPAHDTVFAALAILLVAVGLVAP
jgi:Flp pilus assembly pilin Flp